MSESDDKDSKTEEPTEKKIKDSLEKGQTATSQEVPIMVSLVCFTSYFIFAGEGLILDINRLLGSIFETVGELNLSTSVDAANLFLLIATKIGLLMTPVCLMLMAGGVLSSVMQNEPRLVVDRIAPKLSKLSLIKGWVRLFGKDGLVNFLKSLTKLLFCGCVVVITLYASPEQLLNGMFQNTALFGGVLGGIIQQLLVSVCLAMTIIAIADFIWSRHSWREKLKMSRKEISDEHKQAEGDPILKARMRSIARDRSRQRMMAAVPEATLIIANPTHIAIALRFDAEADDAPVVIAKGQDLIALKIREIAEQNDVPVFERIELARALNKVVQVDQIIPPEFYAAVAELINTIYQRTSQPEG